MDKRTPNAYLQYMLHGKNMKGLGKEVAMVGGVAAITRYCSWRWWRDRGGFILGQLGQDEENVDLYYDNFTAPLFTGQ